MSLDMLGDANAMAVLAVALAAALLICGAISIHRINRLRVRLHLYLHTFETASVGITHVTLDGRWIRVNEKMAELTGYTREELTTMTLSDLTHEDDLPENTALNEKLVAGEVDSYSMEKRYRRKDGRIIWVRIKPTLARHPDGRPHYYITVVEDIDELKRSEIAHQESEARFRAFWDNSPFNQSVKDTLGNLQEVNRTYRETFGIPDTAVSGRSLSETHTAAWAPQIDEFDREVLRSETTRTADISVPGKDDEEIIIRVTKFPIYDTTKQVVGLGGVSYDITNQVEAAQKIREREERFRATFDQAAVGIAHVALDGDWLRINERFCEILGYTEAELRQRSFHDITHPDDLPGALIARAALIADETDSVRRQKRYIRKDGTSVWVTVTGSKTDQSGSQAPYLILVIEDITEQKNAELALAARVERQTAIMGVGQQALTEPNLKALLDDTAETIARVLGVDFCLISQRQRNGSAFSIVSANEVGQKYIGWPVEPRIRHLKTLFEAPAFMPIAFTRGDPGSPDITSPIMEDIGTISAASVVIAGDDHAPRGILVVHNQTRRDFDEDEIAFLQTVANFLSATISRELIASDLAEREDMLNTVLENAADGIILSDADGDIVMANHAAEEIFGFDGDAILGKNLRERGSPRSRTNHRDPRHDDLPGPITLG